MKPNENAFPEILKQEYLPVRPKPPFRLDLTVWTLRRRPDNIMDRWNNHTYSRVMVFGDKPAEISVKQIGPIEDPVLVVSVVGNAVPSRKEAGAFLKKVFGIDIDLSNFYRFVRKTPQLEPLMERFCGVKPPRFPSLFEALVNGISCQQLSLTVGIGLLNKLTQKCGIKLHLPNGTHYAFPTPSDMAGMTIEDFRSIGYSKQKGKALLELSSRIANDDFDPKSIEVMNDERALDMLCELRGVGRWTAEYALLRGLGRTHIFPIDDVGGRSNLQHWLKLPDKLNPEGAKKVLSSFEPYGGLVYFHLLLQSLLQKGIVGSELV